MNYKKVKQRQLFLTEDVAGKFTPQQQKLTSVGLVDFKLATSLMNRKVIQFQNF